MTDLHLRGLPRYMVAAIKDVLQERWRQDTKWGSVAEYRHQQRPEVWLSILVEEVGELADSLAADWRPTPGSITWLLLKHVADCGRAAKALLHNDPGAAREWLRHKSGPKGAPARAWQEPDPSDTELTQVAAVALAWMEARQPELPMAPIMAEPPRTEADQLLAIAHAVRLVMAKGEPLDHDQIDDAYCFYCGEWRDYHDHADDCPWVKLRSEYQAWVDGQYAQV